MIKNKKSPTTKDKKKVVKRITATTNSKNKANSDKNVIKPVQVTYSISPGFVIMLANLKIAIAVTSYQSGKLYLLGCNPKGGLMLDERLFEKAMGLYVDGNEFLLATLFQIHRFQNILEKDQFINHTFDACYVPRINYTTGVLDTHDVGLLKNGEIVFVNTLYNCLATTSSKHSFIPIWKPKFISKIVSEDRCHLNGLAMDNGMPRYVTAVCKSNTIDGWRDRRANGGVVIDVIENEIICNGLSMPHSPRIYNKKLWLLNSGTGELGFVDKEKFHPIAFCPGFLRGLAFADKYAFIGLSKPRYKRFEGLELDNKLKEADSEAWCGIHVIDLETGNCVEWFRIDGDITEIYDIAILKGVSCPMSLGFASNEIKRLITHTELNNKYLESVV